MGRGQYPRNRRTHAQLATDLAERMQTCTKCKVRKPFAAFKAEAFRPGGVSRACLICLGSYNRLVRRKWAPFRWLALIVKHHLTPAGHVWCPRCIDFMRVRVGTKYDCDACSRARFRKSRLARVAANPHMERDRKRRYMKDPRKRERYLKMYRARHLRRRGLELSALGSSTTAQIEQRMAMTGGLCWICGGRGSQTDHVKPLSRGGSNWPANLRAICASCNSRKSARWPYPTTMMGVWGTSFARALDERAA